MSDFEVHKRGTSAELKASRELAAAIEQAIDQWGEGIIQRDVLQAYKRLRGQYIRNLQSEEC
jgi:hypothetical protein